MNFKKIGLGLAATAAMTASIAMAEAPAQALTLSTGDVLQISDDFFAGVTISPTQLDFGQNGFGNVGQFKVVGGGASTGGFAALAGQTGTIQDLSLSSGSLTAPVPGFLSIPIPSGGTLIFNLDTFNTFFTVQPGPFDNLNATLTGIFQNANGATIGEGLFTASLRNNATSGSSGYIIDIVAVPTPALLPGLIGLGAAALRKRKGEQEAEQPEAVKA